MIVQEGCTSRTTPSPVFTTRPRNPSSESPRAHTPGHSFVTAYNSGAESLGYYPRCTNHIDSACPGWMSKRHSIHGNCVLVDYERVNYQSLPSLIDFTISPHFVPAICTPTLFLWRPCHWPIAITGGLHVKLYKSEHNGRVHSIKNSSTQTRRHGCALSNWHLLPRPHLHRSCEPHHSSKRRLRQLEKVPCQRRQPWRMASTRSYHRPLLVGPELQRHRRRVELLC